MKKFNHQNYVNVKFVKMQDKILHKVLNIKSNVKFTVLVNKVNPLVWYIVKHYQDRHYTLISFTGEKKNAYLKRINQVTYSELIRTNYKIVF